MCVYVYTRLVIYERTHRCIYESTYVHIHIKCTLNRTDFQGPISACGVLCAFKQHI